MSGQRFHTNPETGKPGECTAKIKCKFGTPIDEHHDSPEAARVAYEQSQKDNEVSSVKKSDPVASMPANLKAHSFWRGKTVGEAVANMQADYESAKDAKPLDTEVVFNNFESEYGAYYEDYDSRIVFDESLGKYVFEVSKIENYDSYSDDPPSKPFVSNDWVTKNPNGSYDDAGNFIPPSSYDKSDAYRYDVPGLSEQHEKWAIKSALETSYEISNSRNLPLWAALPPAHKSVPFRDFIMYRNKVREIESKETLVRTLEKKMQTNLNNSKKYDSKKRAVDAMKSDIDSLSEVMSDPSQPKIVRETLKEGTVSLEAKFTQAKKSLAIFHPSKNEERNAKIEKDLAQAKREIKVLELDERQFGVRIFVNQLADRHPAENARTRLAAAKAWLRDNSDSYDREWVRKL